MLTPFLARNIFQDVIKKELKTKIVFMICNQLQYAPEADNVIVMDKGRIRSSGKFEQIVHNDSTFAQLMKDHGIEKSSSPSETATESEVTTVESKSLKGQGKSGSLVREEESEKGRVAFGVYSYYAKAAGLLIVAGLFLFRGVVSVMNAIGIWWLSFWTTDIVTSGRTVTYCAYSTMGPLLHNAYPLSQMLEFTRDSTLPKLSSCSFSC
jgi:hypothetical protein